MALEIITAGYCNANVTISRGELIPTCHRIHPIHILSCNIGLVRDNTALEIITGDLLAPNVTISSGNLWTKCLYTRSLDVM